MKPRDTIRKFKLKRGRERTPREAVPGRSFHEVPWRIARNGWSYKRRYQREEQP